ncbi:MAG: VWA domain-containing protein, partial [Dehalococcoidia bacterium]
DTSASMQGGPMAAAREAAIALVQRLAPGDQVAVVSFSDWPAVASPFEAGRDAALAALASLEATGNTALYGALDESFALLAPRDSGARAVVVLSDGEDHGATFGDGSAQERRAASLDAVGASRAQLYAFALGNEADHDYLQEAATRSGGNFWSVTEQGALEELFEHLGDRLGSSTEVSIAVPPMARGEYALELRAIVGGEAALASTSVRVTNEGMLRAGPRDVGDLRDLAAPGAGGPFVIALESSAPDGALRYAASTGGEALEVLGSPPRVLLDPWQFEPGPLPVAVTATLNGAIVATTTVEVDVPALAPELSVLIDGAASSRHATVRGRAQAAPDARIVVALDGEVIAEGAAPEVRVPLPATGGALTARLVGDGGELASAASAVQATPVSTASTAGMMMALTAVGLALLGGVFVVRRRKPKEQDHWRPTGQTMLVGRRLPSSVDAHRTRGVVIVRPPGGEERRYEIGWRPLSFGSDPGCDVMIDDRSVAGLHARLYALGNGDFRVHGIAPHRPLTSTRQDEWMVVHHGEQIAIGEYLLTVLAEDAATGGLEEIA